MCSVHHKSVIQSEIPTWVSYHDDVWIIYDRKKKSEVVMIVSTSHTPSSYQ